VISWLEDLTAVQWSWDRSCVEVVGYEMTKVKLKGQTCLLASEYWMFHHLMSPNCVLEVLSFFLYIYLFVFENFDRFKTN
jgi:hypothetical protein